MHLTFQQLKSALWEAANTLRGSAVDRTDWKGYILPLLFFKRISDVWDEETSDASEIYGDVDPSHFEEVHRFQVPQGCHWTDIPETAANVGDALARAMQEFERANPDTLYRVFGAADWGNREKFADELLKDLIEGFSSISLGNTAVDTDILGDAYEYLVGKFADVTLSSGHDLSALSGLHGAERAPRYAVAFLRNGGCLFGRNGNKSRQSHAAGLAGVDRKVASPGKSAGI